MLFGLLISLFTLACFLIILLILIQKSKSSMGLGSIGGGSQMLFGGSGGQDVFQKATWTLGIIFMVGSLGLAMMQRTTSSSTILHNIGGSQQEQPVVPTLPEIPEE